LDQPWVGVCVDIGDETVDGELQVNDGLEDIALEPLAAVGDDRLKLTEIASRHVHRNSCSHDPSLNCFGRFGNRLNESDH
jgi:hypothetical protein